MKVYGHLRDQHSVELAQKVTFKGGRSLAGRLPGRHGGQRDPCFRRAVLDKENMSR